MGRAISVLAKFFMLPVGRDPTPLTGVSFLKFLLSSERDVDTFATKRSQPRQAHSIEVYPEGLVLLFPASRSSEVKPRAVEKYQLSSPQR